MHHLVSTGLRCAPSNCVDLHNIAILSIVHNVALYRLGGAQYDFACLLSNFLMVYNAVLSD